MANYSEGPQHQENIAERLHNNCLHCGRELMGRSDKKYCSLSCKSAFQYKQSKVRPERFYNLVSNQLRLNRRLLKEQLKTGKSTIKVKSLKSKGFDPRFFTHFHKNKKGHEYCYVYEFGFYETTEKGKDRYKISVWKS